MAALWSFHIGLGPYISAANQAENNVEFWSSPLCPDSARAWLIHCFDFSAFYMLRNIVKIPTRGDVALPPRSVSTSASDWLCMPCVGFVMSFTEENAVELRSVVESLNIRDDGRRKAYISCQNMSLCHCMTFFSTVRHLLGVSFIKSLESQLYPDRTVLSSYAQNVAELS
jgi:hypothetical protein